VQSIGVLHGFWRYSTNGNWTLFSSKKNST